MPFPNIGPGELILILIIALVVLGPGKLPDVAASLRKSVREFRKAATDVSDAVKLDAPAQPPATAQTPTPAAPAPAAAADPAPATPPPPVPAAPPSEAGSTAPATADAPANDSNQS